MPAGGSAARQSLKPHPPAWSKNPEWHLVGVGGRNLDLTLYVGSCMILLSQGYASRRNSIDNS